MQTNEDNKNSATEEEKLDRAYELGYLLVPSLSEDEALNYITSLKNKIKDAQGDVVDEENPELIDLAYEMEKTFENKKSFYKNAYFGWFNFIINTESLAELKKSLDGDMNVIRFLIVKIDKKTAGKSENPTRKSMSFKKNPKNRNENLKDDGGVTADAPQEDVSENEVIDESIDEKIDELVVSS